MPRILFLFSSLILLISQNLFCQDIESTTPKLAPPILKLTFFSPNLSLANTQAIHTKANKAFSFHSLLSQSVPHSTAPQKILAKKNEPLSPLWNFDGNPQDFGSKFKNTLYGVANGKFFTVDANQLGSQWVNQDAIDAHRNNGYRN